MTYGRYPRTAIVALFLVLVSALGAGVWRYGYVQAVVLGEARLTRMVSLCIIYATATRQPPHRQPRAGGF